MKGWYLFALISLLCYGSQSFLYKVAARRGYHTGYVMFTFMGTVALLALFSLLTGGSAPGDLLYVLILSFVNALFFFIVTAATIESLRYVPTNVFYPVFRSNIGLVVIFSLIYFHDPISSPQAIGILLSLLVIVLLIGRGKGMSLPEKGGKKGMVLMFVAFFTGAVVTIVVKFASALRSFMTFILLSYCFNMIFSFVLKDRFQPREEVKKRPSFFIGVVIGLFNFFGFYTLLEAFSSGPLSVVAALVGLSFVIPIALSFFIYKENVTVPKVIAVCVAVVASILLRF